MFAIQGRHVRTIHQESTTFRPEGITISPDGHIYVCDGVNHYVCVFDVNGKFLFSFGAHGSGDECFDYPRDLCFSSDGFSMSLMLTIIEFVYMIKMVNSIESSPLLTSHGV